MVGLAWLPFGSTISELGIGQFYVKSPNHRVDLDDVAILQQRDRAADGSLRSNMTNAETARRARKAAVGDQGDLAAHALSGQRRRRGEHLAHAGTSTRTLIANDDDLAFLVGALLDRLEGVLFAIEAAGRAGEFQVRHARNFNDSALGGEIALEADHATRCGDRLVGRANHVLM